MGYCTNVHAGTSLTEAKANLLRYAGPVRDQVIPHGSLPVGLWLSGKAADELVSGQTALSEFKSWLQQQRLIPYTFNGFPQGDFHQAVVKHAVYEPTWTCNSRAHYTMCLAEILDSLLPPGSVGTISTLPLGWPHCPWHAENYRLAADELIEVAKYCDRLAQRSGTQIVLSIESEPGCVLSTAADVLEFFEHFLFRGPDAQLAKQYLGVCHDICHSGVMFESQTAVLEGYRQAGIRVGKVQISSAVHVAWDEAVANGPQQDRMLAQIQGFSEPKYLHQTTIRSARGGLEKITDDLPQALKTWLAAGMPTQPWRIHFHVPIFVEKFGDLATTQGDISEACRYLQQHQADATANGPWFTGHYEVETYAWPVLPAELQQADLAIGIAKELEFARTMLAALT